MQKPLRPQHPQEHARAAVKRDLQNGSLTAATNLAATPAATPTGTPFPVKPKRVGHSGRRPRYCHRWSGCRPLPALRPAALRPATLRPAMPVPVPLLPSAARVVGCPVVPRGGGAAATTSADSATENVTSAAATAATHLNSSRTCSTAPTRTSSHASSSAPVLAGTRSSHCRLRSSFCTSARGQDPDPGPDSYPDPGRAKAHSAAAGGCGGCGGCRDVRPAAAAPCLMSSARSAARERTISARLVPYLQGVRRHW